MRPRSLTAGAVAVSGELGIVRRDFGLVPNGFDLRGGIEGEADEFFVSPGGAVGGRYVLGGVDPEFVVGWVAPDVESVADGEFFWSRALPIGDHDGHIEDFGVFLFFGASDDLASVEDGLAVWCDERAGVVAFLGQDDADTFAVPGIESLELVSGTVSEGFGSVGADVMRPDGFGVGTGERFDPE